MIEVTPKKLRPKQENKYIVPDYSDDNNDEISNYKFYWKSLFKPNLSWTCFAKLCDKNGHSKGFIPHIVFFLNPLGISAPCVEILFFMNNYFIVSIFNSRISLHKFD